MFDGLQEALSGIFRKLGGRGRLSEKNIQEGLQEVRRALLQADVNFKVVKDFIARVTEKAVGQDVLKSINPTQMFIKVVHDELVELMGPVDHAIPAPQGAPTVVMMVGLQGSGKTTTTAKLALFLRKKGRKPMLVAADMVRPAAVEQLKTLGKQHDLPVYSEASGRPVKICRRAVAEAEKQACDLVILDTQGRLHIDDEMMDELVEIKQMLKPQQVYLVSDAMTGQDAVNSAGEFHRRLGLDGVVMTKLDGDARGGAALSVKAVTGCPIKFVGVGEKIENLEEFHPERMAGRILGMGDVVSLVEKAQEAIDEESARKLQEKIAKDELTLTDFYQQLQRMKKIGPLKSIMKLLPGSWGQAASEVDEEDLKGAEAIIQSMTVEEREFPEVLNGSRKQRIARGSGRAVHEINSLIKQFDEARRMIRKIKKGKFDPEDLDPTKRRRR